MIWFCLTKFGESVNPSKLFISQKRKAITCQHAQCAPEYTPMIPNDALQVLSVGLPGWAPHPVAHYSSN